MMENTSGTRRKRRHNYFQSATKKRNLFNEEDDDDYELNKEKLEAMNEDKEEKEETQIKEDFIWNDSQESNEQVQKEHQLEKPKQKLNVQTLIFEQSSEESENNDVQLNTSQEQPKQQVICFTDIVSFVQTQIIMKNLLQLNITRNVQWTNKFRPLFFLTIEKTNDFLMAAKQTSSDTFIISHSGTNFQQNGPSYIGKIKTNFSGTLINIFGEGLNPKNAKEKIIMPRQLLATVIYQQSLMKEAKPRDFKVFLKKENVNYYTNLSGVKLYDEEVPLNELYYHQGNQDKIRLLENRKGKWNEKAECYTLNMKKRAKKASIKNFILEETSNPEYNCLLLGKVKDNSFNLDVSFPLTPFLAFCIGLTTFVSKIGC